MGQQLRPVLGLRGSAQTWVGQHELLVELLGSARSAYQLVVSSLSGGLPSRMETTFDGTLRLEMEMERYLDYHREAAIWFPGGEVVFIDSRRRCQLHSALSRGLLGSASEKDQALRELGTLLGIPLGECRSREVSEGVMAFADGGSS